jgi:hypothetical protein
MRTRPPNPNPQTLKKALLSDSRLARDDGPTERPHDHATTRDVLTLHSFRFSFPPNPLLSNSSSRPPSWFPRSRRLSASTPPPPRAAW